MPKRGPGDKRPSYGRGFVRWLSTAYCLFQEVGGARQIPSARTKAHTVGSEFLPQQLGCDCLHPTVRSALSPAWSGAFVRKSDSGQRTVLLLIATSPWPRTSPHT